MYVQSTVQGDKRNQNWKLLHCQLILPFILCCRLKHYRIKILEINIYSASLAKYIFNSQQMHSYYTNFSLFLLLAVVYACLLSRVILFWGCFSLQVVQLLQLCNTQFCTEPGSVVSLEVLHSQWWWFPFHQHKLSKCTIAAFFCAIRNLFWTKVLVCRGYVLSWACLELWTCETLTSFRCRGLNCDRSTVL